MKKEILELYGLKKELIKNRLKYFSDLSSKDYVKEFVFCLLTPQSNAFKCWDAVEKIFSQVKFDNEKIIKDILRTRTRFHNTKAKRVVEGLSEWNEIEEKLNEKDIVKLRNWLSENVNGYGLKESGHFIRNIGKSNSEIAILDRHILRNLLQLGVISDDKIKGRKNYLEIEKKFKEFSLEIGIPMDELDLLFWSKENGEIFK